MSTPRLRFAPSPTGYLHVGGARTALFNWLYARKTGGAFVLRIEDTDVERSSADMVTGILDGMRWLGLDWDEGPEAGGAHGPYFQSQRLARYRELAEQLVREGHAYYCYCGTDKERPDGPAFAGDARAAASGGGSAADREGGEGGTPRGESWTYDRRCSRLTPEEVAAREAAGAPRAIRFRVPEGETAFRDLVHGDITFDNAHIEDFVALRSDGHPTYHLSVVADDIDMAITHVVRGDDHISNTPKQVLLYRAFGKPLPAFAHVPLILGPDKRRLSKRHGATSVTEYRRQGYLPEAMMNFLALLGWSPGSDQELFTRDELVAAFSLEGISLSNAVFNPEKLEWFSAQHIARMPSPELVRRVEPLLEEAGLWPVRPGPESPVAGAPGPAIAWLARLVELLRPRAKRLTDFVEKGRPFLVEHIEYDAAAVQKYLSSPEARAHLAAVGEACASVEPFAAAALEPAIRALAGSRGVKAGALVHPTRVAVVGRAESPGLFEVLELLGRERVLARIGRALRLGA
ncbi:MAG TPA: glutamate--tRNA ligase [Vicinamibacterales bacterium]|nr:glutamate--tRNA ligase [Vicinamibacterales bacterium]HPW20988.1 glutamate--tRNA ligase [Vicinamibacterales bacterium]